MVKLNSVYCGQNLLNGIYCYYESDVSINGAVGVEDANTQLHF